MNIFDRKKTKHFKPDVTNLSKKNINIVDTLEPTFLLPPCTYPKE